MNPVCGRWTSTSLGDGYDLMPEDAMLILPAKVGFLRADIEALAVKMNDEPDPKAMQEENQRLRQELQALKAEVERLQSENDRLKTDEEISPREKETLYKMIAAMAIDGYRHDPSAGQNSTVKKLDNALGSIGEPLGEKTIRKHLNAAIGRLPAKPIKA